MSETLLTNAERRAVLASLKVRERGAIVTSLVGDHPALFDQLVRDNLPDSLPSRFRPQEPEQTDRADRLLQLPQVSEITTLSEATIRWLRHNNEGPPLFKLGRRLVCWESALYAWIAERQAQDGGAPC